MANDYGALACHDHLASDLVRMKTRSFRDLQVWQRSMALAHAVFDLTADFPAAQTFGLTSQMQRSAVSVPSNIAEGHGRLTDRSFAQFLSQARGSLYELQTQLELATGMSFASAPDCRRLLADALEIEKMLNSLLTKVRRPDQH
jgi:four helix bundle protein